MDYVINIFTVLIMIPRAAYSMIENIEEMYL